MAGVNNVAEELVRVLLTTTAEMLSEDPETALNLGRSVVREIQLERTRNLLLEYAERARGRSRRIT